MDLQDGDDKALKDLEDEDVKVTLLPQKEVDLFYIRDTHVSKTSLLKYYIADALPELDKVIYIDSDVLVLHDLNELYNTNIEDKYLAVVKDPSWFFENGHVLELNLSERGFYFNSGVMLMNLKKIRDDGLVKKLEDYTNNNFRTYMDQDALNVVVGNDVALLDVKYNTMNFFFEHNSIKTLADFYGKNWSSYEEVFAPSVVIHFASSKKPLGTIVPKTEFFYMLQKLWYKYYRELKPLDM
jgi:lipopolysaccharide biosynthesis glycosyltransferase